MSLQLLTIQETALLLKVQPQAVYNLIYSGELPSTTVGNRRRVRQSDVEAFLAKGAVGDQPPTPDTKDEAIRTIIREELEAYKEDVRQIVREELTNWYNKDMTKFMNEMEVALSRDRRADGRSAEEHEGSLGGD